jgi:hypothetical protein
VARADAAALEREKNRLDQPFVKGKDPKGKKGTGGGAPRGFVYALEAEDERTAMRSIGLWEGRYIPEAPETIWKKAEEARRTAPEIDAGPAATAVALLVAGVLMLADRRRVRAA